LIVVLLALITMAAGPGRRSVAGLVLIGLLAWRVLPPFWRACRTPGPGPIRQAVKAGVLSLVLVDASIGAAYAGAAYGLVIVATAVVAAALARLFPVT
jgi:hypothetical protein